MAIAIEEGGGEAYVRVTAKVGVVSSNKAYRTGSPSGEHEARGTRYTWRLLET
jgi:hypothetical protein